MTARFYHTPYGFTCYPNGADKRVELGDNSMQLHFNPIIKGTGASDTTLPNRTPSMTFKLPHSSGGADVPLLNIATGNFGVQFTVSALENGTPLSFQLYTRDCEQTTKRFEIPGGPGNVDATVNKANLKMVDGFFKLKVHTLATLPYAYTAGEGAIAYVSDDSTGPVLAFSDGSYWRRSTDQSVVF